MILLIGGSSFIGVHTVNELLWQGCKVAVTCRNDKFRNYYEGLGVEYYNLDISEEKDFHSLPKNGIDSVILLAGLLPANCEVDLDKDDNAAEYFMINTLGTIYLLEYCRKNGINKIISTCSYQDVIKSWRAYPPLEDDAPRSCNYSGDHAVYVFSKNAANDMLEYYNSQHNMSNVIFRLPPVYGAGPHLTYCINGKRTKSAIAKFMEAASKGEPIYIFDGDENYIRDYIYVKDVARALYMASVSDKAKGLYNMTSGAGVSFAQQIRVIADVFAEGKKSPIINSTRLAGSHVSNVFSMEKALKDFGFRPEYSSFRKMMEDYKEDLKQDLYSDLFGSYL